jgi:hypothetical protein
VAVEIEALQLGVVFLYHGPRRWWPPGRREVAVGRVLALDSDDGIAHVRTYRSTPSPEQLDVDVAHIPILCSSLVKSMQSILRVQPPDAGDYGVVHRWRDRHNRHEVGAFSGSLWSAEEMAWEATLEQSPDDVVIEYAYPKADAEGRFRIVEVECKRRALRPAPCVLR